MTTPTCTPACVAPTAGTTKCASTNVCTPTCNTAGHSICTNACVDQNTDKNNCGVCGTKCEGYQYCGAGKCVPHYESTTLLPIVEATSGTLTAAPVFAAAASQDDLILGIILYGDTVTFSKPGDFIRNANSYGLARYTSAGLLFWAEDLRTVISGIGLNIIPGALSDAGDILLSNFFDDHQLFMVSGNNGGLKWKIDYSTASIDIQRLVARRGRDDFLSIGGTNGGKVALIAGDGSKITSLGANVANGALSTASGTIWLWGGARNMAQLDPWNPSMVSVGGAPAYIAGDSGNGSTIGPWFSEGQFTPFWNLVDDRMGNLIIFSAVFGPTRVNGQDLTAMTSDGATITKFEPTQGKIVWSRDVVIGTDTDAFLAPDGNIILQDKGSGNSILTFIASANAGTLSSFPIPGKQGTNVLVTAGATNMYVVGTVDSSQDFNPGAGTDRQGSTSPAIFFSRYSF